MFIVFAFDLYYPYGGANDIVNVYTTKEEAVIDMYKSLLTYDKAHVYDVVAKEVILP